MPSASFDFATAYGTMGAAFVGFMVLQWALESLVLPRVWPYIQRRAGDPLPPAGHGAGTMNDMSVRVTSSVFSVIVASNAYAVLRNKGMQHRAAAGLLPGMGAASAGQDWTGGCTWEATHCDGHFWGVSVVGGYMLYDTIATLRGLEHESNGAAQTLAHHIVVLGTIAPGALHNSWCWVGSGLLTFFTEVTGPLLNLIWILKAAGYKGHWLELANGLVFAMVFCFARIYGLGVATYIAFSEFESWDAAGVANAPRYPFNSSSIPGGGYPLQDSFLGSYPFGVLLTTTLYLVSLTWVPPVLKGVIGAALKFMGKSADFDDTDEKFTANAMAAAAGAAKKAKAQ